MQIASDAREYATIDITVDFDPTGDVYFLIDDTRYQASWVAASTTNADGTYSRSAQLLVAGPDVDQTLGTNPAGTVVLQSGRHQVSWLLADDPELVERPGTAAIDIA